MYLIIKSFILHLLSWVARAVYRPPNMGSSMIFPVTGNVYPIGYYHVTMSIGEPPRPYFLDIDTGSVLTWVQCDAPSVKCTPAPNSLYTPNNNLVECEDPICVAVHGDSHYCERPDDQCDYEVEYSDGCSSLGVLVKDAFSLSYINGTMVAPRLAFGCGYDQEVPNSVQPPYTDGILGLGIGKPSIVDQLHESGVTENLFGHCLSGQGGGFVFFAGHGFIPASDVVWAPTSRESQHYSLESVDLLFGGKATDVKGLSVVFDSGSTYTYFKTQAYHTLVSMITQELDKKRLLEAVEDRNLPLCWRSREPFESISDTARYFKTLALKIGNVRFELRPQAYLIVTEHGNACLGILNGGEVGLGDLNILGDISMQDKMVIYDNERQKIGWAATNCSRLPNSSPN